MINRLALLLVVSLIATTANASQSVVRVGVLKFGTVNWELNTIQHHKLDEANGVSLEVVPLASKNATSVAMQGGAVDIIVSDWIWVSRQRAAGRGYTFFPYSKTVGGLLLAGSDGAGSGSLAGKKIGIAGGPVDKTWLLLQAHARAQHNLELTDVIEPVFAAPPVLNKLAMKGEVDGVVTFWHFAARLRAKRSWQELRATDMLADLGVTGEVPLLGWVFDDQWAADNAAAVDGFLRASYAAKSLLLSSDDEWERLRAKTKAEDGATLAALRDGYRAGVPRGFGDAEIATARTVFDILAREGGEKLVGSSMTLNDGTFWTGTQVNWPK